ncbi:MAG TPA: hypothetical protein VJ827_06145 [Rubrobacter sp.]|nr:hypothetical protein [Rubrobacter sp.]
MAETVRYLPRTAAPILYAAGFVPVILGVVVVVPVIENTIGFDSSATFHYNGDVAAAGSVLVIGGFVFGLLAWVLVRLERLQRPAIRDHMRHCVVLYAALITLVVKLISAYESSAAHGISPGYGLTATALFVVGYAISIDATMLALQRRRFDRTPLGGVT